MGEALVPGNSTFIVYGERKSGVGTLWQKYMVRAAATDLLVVAIEQWDGRQLQVREVRKSEEVHKAGAVLSQPTPAPAWQASAVRALRSALDATTDVAVEGAFSDLAAMLAQGQHRCALVLNSVEQVTPARPLFWYELRNRLEAMESPITMAAFARAPFSTEGVTSYVADLCHHYRLAPWSDHDVIEVASGEGVTLQEAEASVLVRLTGGQPKVVDHCLQQWKGTANTSPTEDQVRELLDTLVWSPPAFVKPWQDALRGILADRSLRELFGEYVRGKRSPLEGADAPLLQELPLYVAGWVGPDATRTNWGVRSWLHQSWGRAVLQQLERGRR